MNAAETTRPRAILNCRDLIDRTYLFNRRLCFEQGRRQLLHHTKNNFLNAFLCLFPGPERGRANGCHRCISERHLVNNIAALGFDILNNIVVRMRCAREQRCRQGCYYSQRPTPSGPRSISSRADARSPDLSRHHAWQALSMPRQNYYHMKGRAANRL